MYIEKDSILTKLIAFVLVIATAATILPTGFCLKSHANELPEEANVPEIISPEDVDEYELTSRDILSEDDLYSFVFNNRNGGKTQLYYPYPVKYIDASGEVKDKTSKLTEDDNAYISEASDISASFGKKLADGITVSYEKYSISLIPQFDTEAIGVLSEDKRTVIYETSFGYISYTLSYDGIKEEIVLREYNGINAWSFTAATENAIIKEENGQLCLMNGNEPVMYFGSIFCFTNDEKNNTFGEINVKENDKNGNYIITVAAPKDWLTSPDTEYPVTVDPTIRVSYSSGSSAMQDLSVGPTDSPSHSNDALYVGKNSGHGIQRALVCFPNLNVSGKNIVSAKYEIRDVMCNSSPTVEVDCYEYTGNSWTESSSVNWSNMQQFGELLDTNYVKWANGNTKDDRQRYSFDITPVVQKWAAGILSPSQGILFKTTQSGENSSSDYMAFFASKEYGDQTIRPSLVVAYVEPNGYNPSYTFDQRTLDDHLTLYNYHNYGNLLAVYSFDNINTKGFPLPLFYAYNSRSDSWRFSLDVSLSYENGVYRYRDGYGTDYYFTYDGSEYVNETLDATVTFLGGTTYTLEFSDGTKITYCESAGELDKIEFDNNVYTYSYGSYGIDGIYKNGSRIYSFTYENRNLKTAFGYTLSFQNGKLASIADKYGNVTNFTYTYSSSVLTGFDAKSQLTTNGVKVFFDATSKKVTRAVEYRGTISNNITDDAYTYSSQATSVSSNLKNIDANDPNNQKITYVFDYNGYTVNEIVYNNGSYDSISATDIRSDDIAEGNIVGNGAINYLTDSSFESSAWMLGSKVSAGEALFGKYYMSVSSRAYQSISLAAGTYCFSAYVKGEDSKASLSVAVSNATIASSKQFVCQDDWIRIYTTFTLTRQTDITLYINNLRSGSLLYADCVQLEKGNAPTTYNILQNSGFESGNTGWTGGSGSTYMLFDQYTRAVSPNSQTYQSVNLGGAASDRSYTISGWCYSFSLNNDVRIAVTFYGSNGNSTVEVPFTGHSTGNRFLCAQIVPENIGNVSSATVSVKNKSQSATIYCDNILLSIGNISRDNGSVDASGFTYSSNGDGTCILTGIGSCDDEYITIPEKSPAGDSVTSIAENAFYGNGTIKSVSIGGNVVAIGMDAFRNCSSLETVLLGEGLEHIGYDAFLGCSAIESIILPNTVNRIDGYVFENCINLEAVYIPSSVTNIPIECFHNCSNNIKLYYKGNASAWANVTKGSNAIPAGAQIIYNAEVKDGNVYLYTKSGSYVTSTEVIPFGSATLINRYRYDSNGNVTYYEDKNGNATYYTYNSDGNVTQISTNGRTTTYEYNSKGDVITETVLMGENPSQITRYIYYSNGLLQSLSKDNSKITYNYTNGLLTSVQIGDPCTETYTYTYNSYGNVTQIRLGSTTICSYTYTMGGRGNIRSKTESNGYTEYFTYDSHGNLIETEAGSSDKSSTEYDVYGNVLAFHDDMNDTVEVYVYTPDCLYTVYVFDTYDNLVKYTDFAGNIVFEDGTVLTDGNENVSVNRETDDMSRETEFAIELLNGSSGNNILSIGRVYSDQNLLYSSSEVVTETFSDGPTFAYIYDKAGNLTEVSENSVIKQKYTYDTKNQLVREDNAYSGKSYTWSYDNNGNIISKKTYSFTTGSLGTATETVTYSYGNSNVKDLLTSYNGTSITYSGLNPTKWRNASNITWEGRRMTSLTSPSGTTTHYIYDASGRRTTKYSASNETEYVWDDEKLIREITANYTISYYYDGSEVIGFNVLGSNYYYGKDSFGVIRYLYGENGAVCTTYTYDAWGRVLSIAGSNTQIGQINPIRYKSYYYDTETGFYFLQSRYYDPTIGRFLNADDPSYLGVSGTVLGWNLFAYCENNSVTNVDSYGTFRTPIQLICSIIGGIAGWFFGDFFARKLGLMPKGNGLWNATKYWAIRASAVAGGFALGWFAATTLKTIIQSFLVQNPSVLLSLVTKTSASVLAMSIIYDIVKAAVFDAGCIVLDAIKCPISKAMYAHGLYGNGRQYSSKLLNEQVKSNSNFYDKVKATTRSITENLISGVVISMQGNEWNDRDLAYSIGAVEFRINGYKYNGIWHLVISADNEYDFTEWQMKANGFSLGSAANDLGHVLTILKMMNTYNIHICFAMTVAA